VERDIANILHRDTIAVIVGSQMFEAERVEAEHGLGVLREALQTIPSPTLVDRLLVLARRDPDIANELKRMCLEVLAGQ
jgi:hypothetical protein